MWKRRVARRRNEKETYPARLRRQGKENTTGNQGTFQDGHAHKCSKIYVLSPSGFVRRFYWVVDRLVPLQIGLVKKKSHQ